MNVQDRRIIFFDGECNFCNAGIDFYRRRDKLNTLRYSALQSPFSKKFLRSFNIDANQMSTMFFYEQGRLYKKSRAVARALASLGGFYNALSWLIKITPAFLADSIYDIVASIRYKIMGRRSTCRLGSEINSHLFLVHPED